MSEKKLATTPKTDELLTKWIEAKQNEKGWAGVRAEIEKELTEEYSGFQGMLAEIDEKPVLTTSADLGEDMKVTAGYGLVISQPDAVAFVESNPTLLGIMFRKEYKPVAGAILKAIDSKSDLGKALEKIVSYKEKKPAYALK